MEAYTRAIRGARRQSDYLIERARMLFPGANAEQKVKAMNFLLPHIRRMPEKLARDQFAGDAAQKLGIDSTILREQLRQAALRRQDHIEVRAAALTEVERVLLRALSIVDPEHQDARALAAGAIMQEPAWFEGLTHVSGVAGAGRPPRPGSHGNRAPTTPSAGCWPRRCSAKLRRRPKRKFRAPFSRRRKRPSSAASGSCARLLPRPSAAEISPSWPC